MAQAADGGTAPTLLIPRDVIPIALARQLVEFLGTEKAGAVWEALGQELQGAAKASQKPPANKGKSLPRGRKNRPSRSREALGPIPW